MQIKSFLVEDNIAALDYLVSILKQFPFIDIVGNSTSSEDAKSKIDFYKPDLLFLDIQLAKDTSFDILNSCNGNYKFVIFITAYEEYALKAYQFNTVHYILKPYTKEDIIEALNKIKKIYSCFQPSISTQEIDLLQNRLIQPFTSNQLSQNFDSFFFFDNKKWQSIPFSEIIYLQGDGSYTTFFTNTFSKKISRNLKTNGAVFLTQPNFVRIHNKYIVNTNYIETVIRGLKPQVILKNHITLAVSLRQRDHLFSFMGIKKSK